MVRVENAALALDVVPALGGKILHLIDKAADRNVLWRHPRIAPHRAPLQSNLDDHFSGGWDDAFPTCAPSKNRSGDELPYLGEVWTLGLSYELLEAGPGAARIRLSGQTPITTARWTREISLEGDRPVVTLDTTIENVGFLPMEFNWGSHAAMSVSPGSRVDIPATSVSIDDAGGGALGTIGDKFNYPILELGDGRQLDIREVQSPTVGAYALYLTEGLNAGWVAVTDPAIQRGFGIVFDPEVQRSVWQWTVYGGFRGWYHVIVEPWLAPAPALADAVQRGIAWTLNPGERFTSQMQGVLYAGVSSVANLSGDGAVVAGPP